MEWAKQTYNKQYENWVPWLEDNYLAWFGENKSSYVAKGMSWFVFVKCFMSSRLVPASTVIICSGLVPVQRISVSRLWDSPSFSDHWTPNGSNWVPVNFVLANTTSRSDNLSKTKITGDKSVDAIQDGVNEGVGGQLGKGGLLEGVGSLGSKEVFTRSERGGKGESGGAL